MPCERKDFAAEVDVHRLEDSAGDAGLRALLEAHRRFHRDAAAPAGEEKPRAAQADASETKTKVLIPLRVRFIPEIDGRWTAHCLDFDLCGTGRTQDEALKELGHAIGVQVECSIKYRNPANLLSLEFAPPASGAPADAGEAMGEEELAELEKLERKASPPPWKRDWTTDVDMNLAAAARNALPRLLAELRRLRGGR